MTWHHDGLKIIEESLSASQRNNKHGVLQVDNSQYSRRPHGKLNHGTFALIEVSSQSTDTKDSIHSSWHTRWQPSVATVSGQRISIKSSHVGWYYRKDFWINGKIRSINFFN
jgi:hypothetical protein